MNQKIFLLLKSEKSTKGLFTYDYNNRVLSAIEKTIKFLENYFWRKKEG